jgi:ABC-type transport system involved in Fe-S cluster assembly fused permease/ATPase subunit
LICTIIDVLCVSLSLSVCLCLCLSLPVNVYFAIVIVIMLLLYHSYNTVFLATFYLLFASNIATSLSRALLRRSQCNSNQIASFQEVEKLAVCSKLETVYLEHNPIFRDVQYRNKVLVVLPWLEQLDATRVLKGANPLLAMPYSR